jgi:hypothetical protein
MALKTQSNAMRQCSIKETKELEVKVRDALVSEKTASEQLEFLTTAVSAVVKSLHAVTVDVSGSIPDSGDDVRQGNRGSSMRSDRRRADLRAASQSISREVRLNARSELAVSSVVRDLADTVCQLLNEATTGNEREESLCSMLAKKQEECESATRLIKTIEPKLIKAKASLGQVDQVLADLVPLLLDSTDRDTVKHGRGGSLASGSASSAEAGDLGGTARSKAHDRNESLQQLHAGTPPPCRILTQYMLPRCVLKHACTNAFVRRYCRAREGRSFRAAAPGRQRNGEGGQRSAPAAGKAPKMFHQKTPA